MNKSTKNIVDCYNKGYRSTKDGNIIGLKGSKLKLRIKNTGYKIFCFRNSDSVPKNILVHRLIAYEKFGERIFEEGIVVRHLDGVCTNNKWTNIEIGTYSDNMMDKKASDRTKHAKHASSFITIHDHDTIRDYYKNNKVTYKDLMNKFNISSKGTVSYIINKI